MGDIVYLQDSVCNGVLFSVSDEDFKKFDEREMTYGYKKVEIDFDKVDFISKDHGITKNDSLWVYVLKDDFISENVFIWSSYVDVILNGCLEYGREFAEEFVKTTHDWTKIINYRENPIYSRGVKNLVNKDLRTCLRSLKFFWLKIKVLNL